MTLVERLDPLIEFAAERLHKARVIIRYLKYAAINTSIRRFLDAEKFVADLAIDRAYGRDIKPGDGRKVLWAIARNGIAPLNFPLTDDERAKYAKKADYCMHESATRDRTVFSVDLGILEVPDIHKALAMQYKYNAHDGVASRFFVVDRQTRISAGRMFLKTEPENVRVIAGCKRFPRPVRREAKKVMRQQQLAMRN